MHNWAASMLSNCIFRKIHCVLSKYSRMCFCQQQVTIHISSDNSDSSRIIRPKQREHFYVQQVAPSPTILEITVLFIVGFCVDKNNKISLVISTSARKILWFYTKNSALFHKLVPKRITKLHWFAHWIGGARIAWSNIANIWHCPCIH